MDVAENRDSDRERERQLAAERTRRYRERKAGKAVPLRKSGPEPTTERQRRDELKRLRAENAELRQRVAELERQLESVQQ